MNKDKKEKIFFIIALIVIIPILYFSDGVRRPDEVKHSFFASRQERAYDILKDHLKKRYNEEFVIEYLVERQVRGEKRYEGAIYPQSYIGTKKARSQYYAATGYVRDGIPDDNFNKILFTEDVSEHFRPKLEEQFGKNILSIFNFDIAYGLSTYKSHVERFGSGPSLDGAVYIFGSIKNEKDIKRYQKGIFEFVQYLKAEDNNFDYTKIAFIVIDERVLEDDFEDLGLKYELIRAKEESKTEKEFLAKREKIMSQIKITSKDKSDRIEGINREGITMSYEYHGYTAIVGTTVISPSMFKANHLTYPDWYPEEFGKTYDKVEEIALRKRNYFEER